MRATRDGYPLHAILLGCVAASLPCPAMGQDLGAVRWHSDDARIFAVPNPDSECSAATHDCGALFVGTGSGEGVLPVGRYRIWAGPSLSGVARSALVLKVTAQHPMDVRVSIESHEWVGALGGAGIFAGLVLLITGWTVDDHLEAIDPWIFYGSTIGADTLGLVLLVAGLTIGPSVDVQSELEHSL